MNIYIYIYIYIYTCIISMSVLHEVKNQHVLVKRTSKIMNNGQDVIIQMGSGTRCFR